MLDEDGVVWKTCGKRVDNWPATPALDDEDAWRERYIGGPIGRYIIGGPTDALPIPDPEPPPNDPELDKYRRSVAVPPWMREGGDQ